MPMHLSCSLASHLLRDTSVTRCGKIMAAGGRWCDTVKTIGALCGLWGKSGGAAGGGGAGALGASVSES